MTETDIFDAEGNTIRYSPEGSINNYINNTTNPNVTNHHSR